MHESSWDSDADDGVTDDNPSHVGLGEANSLSLSSTGGLIESDEVCCVSSTFWVESASSRLGRSTGPASGVSGQEETEKTENGPRFSAQPSPEYPSSSTSRAVTAADDNSWSTPGARGRN